jgi:hypothetical protein
VAGLHYNSITINLHNKHGKNTPPVDLGTPLANDPRVREALELTIDREALNQVAWDGQYTPGCTPISPVSPFYDKGRKCPARDVAKVLKDRCQLCHAAQPDFGAPMPLVTYADTQAVADGGLRMWRRMKNRIVDGTMPQNGKLTDAEKATLMNWFDAGALGSAKSCTGGTGGSAGIGGSAGSSGSSGSAGIGGSAGTSGSAGKGGTSGSAGKGGTGGTGISGPGRR